MQIASGVVIEQVRVVDEDLLAKELKINTLDREIQKVVIRGFIERHHFHYYSRNSKNFRIWKAVEEAHNLGCSTVVVRSH